MKLKIIYQDKNLLIIDKPVNIIVFPEKETTERTLIDLLLKQFPYLRKVGKPPRYGIVHRLDKDTSGILLIAKNNKSLSFLQKQFKNRKVVKRYIALLSGKLKETQGEIKTLIGRSPKNRVKQKVYLPLEPGSEGKRTAVTKYRVLLPLRSISKGGRRNYYTLVGVTLRTGRKHQIRTHFSYLGHPVAGDRLYSFKNQVHPESLKRQFLHAGFLKIKLLNDKEKEFKSEIPRDLKKVLEKMEEDSQ
ncbi:MAG: RluA family pseudouridine synthase [Candidatus Nealsonbacteria bacterium]